MANNEALREVMIHVTYEPRRLDMGNWASTSQESPCGTTACIAGWAVILRGNLPVVISADKMHLPPGRSAEWEGRELLGLTELEAARLFHVWNDEVWEVVEDITKGLVNRAEVEAYCAAHPLPKRQLRALPESVLEPKVLTDAQKRALKAAIYEGELDETTRPATVAILRERGLVERDSLYLTEIGNGMANRIDEDELV